LDGEYEWLVGWWKMYVGAGRLADSGEEMGGKIGAMGGKIGAMYIIYWDMYIKGECGT
jgi:hypothetical protein